MSEKTLKVNNIRLNQKEFYNSKNPIQLMSVIVDQIVVSDKFKHNNESFKYFICYQECGIVKPLCIILPQMSGYVKSLENGSKNMSFMIKEKYDNYCGKNTIKFGISLKINQVLNFIANLFMNLNT